MAKGVHSAYEDGLVNFHSTEIMDALHKTFKGKSHSQPLIKNHGPGAAAAVVDLMQQTFKAIQPAKIVQAYVPIKKLKPKDVADHLWNQFGKATVNVMADGARTLAMLWDSAWKEGGGAHAMASKGKISQDSFKGLYTQPKFLESFTLAQIQPVLTGVASSGSAGVQSSPTRRKATAGGKAGKKQPVTKRVAKKQAPRKKR